MLDSNMPKSTSKPLENVVSVVAPNNESDAELIHYGGGSIVLTSDEMAQVKHDIENPPEPTEGLYQILKSIDRGYSP